MKIMHTLVVMSMALSLSVAHAGEREPKIDSNTSGISDSEFISNIAGASVGMGAKEPLSISASRNGGKLVVVVTGSNGTSCKIPTSGNPPQMQGINCQ